MSTKFLAFLAILHYCCIYWSEAVNRQNAAANQFCVHNRLHRNVKDLYADPFDCHSYYQCFFLNEENVVGIMRKCPDGGYWNSSSLTCQPEWKLCSISPCLNPTISAIGCYQLPDEPCGQYYSCTFNERRCCEPGSRFNPDTCGCDEDETCEDDCEALPRHPLQPTSLNETHCKDKFGNILRLVDHRSDVFEVDGAILSCSDGTEFSMAKCECSVPLPIEEEPASRQCLLWLPFDDNTEDHSTSQFTTFAFDNAVIDTSISAVGEGSLYLNPGRLEIPSLRNVKLNSEGASWCFFFRCEEEGSPDDSAHHTPCSGGILSNNAGPGLVNSHFMAALESADKLEAHLNTSSGLFSASVDVEQQPPEWNHACIVYSGEELSVYINSALVDSQPADGDVSTTHWPYVIGTDRMRGDFVGHIDEVLICNSALDAHEVEAHYKGDRDALSEAGLISL